MNISGRTMVTFKMSLFEGEIELERAVTALAETLEDFKRLNPQDEEMPAVLLGIKRAQKAILMFENKLESLAALSGYEPVELPIGQPTIEITPPPKADSNYVEEEEDHDDDEAEDEAWQSPTKEELAENLNDLTDKFSNSLTFEQSASLAASMVMLEAAYRRKLRNPMRQNTAGLVLLRLLNAADIKYFSPTATTLAADFFKSVIVDIPLVRFSELPTKQPARAFRNLTTSKKFSIRKLNFPDRLNPEKIETVFTYDLEDQQSIDDELLRGGISIEQIESYASTLRSKFAIEATNLSRISNQAQKIDDSVTYAGPTD